MLSAPYSSYTLTSMGLKHPKTIKNLWDFNGFQSISLTSTVPSACKAAPIRVFNRSSRRADARHFEGQVAPHGRRARDEADVEALSAPLVQQGVVHHGGLRGTDVALQDVVPGHETRTSTYGIYGPEMPVAAWLLDRLPAVQSKLDGFS